MNVLDKQYQDLLQDILDNGVTKKDRTGTGTVSVFGRQIRHKMSDGFPLLTTKKMPFKTIVTELLWFLRGDTNIKYLVDNNCHIWDGDAFKRYESSVGLSSNPHDYKIDSVSSIEGIKGMGAFKIKGPFTKEEFIDKIKTDDRFAKTWGDLGPIYGKQWRSWERYGYRGVQNGALDCGLISMEDYKKEMYIDQIQNSINLLKTDPDSRRNRVSAWNVGEIDQMVLPPCHTDFQFFTRELSDVERFEISFNKYETPIGWKTMSWVQNKDWNPNNETRIEVMDRLNVPKRAVSLMWNQRSVDTFLGLPFNIASYGLLLEIIAKEVNMVPDELIGNLGDTHLYLNHIEQAKEQIGRKYTQEERIEELKKAMGEEAYQAVANEIKPFGGGLSEYFSLYEIRPNLHTREPYPLPTLKIKETLYEHGNPHPERMDLESYSLFSFELENYQSHSTIKAPLSN